MFKLKSHSLTLSFTHSWHAEHLLISCLCSKVTLSLSHSLTIDMICLCSKVTLTLSLTHSPTHSVSLNMLNNFCFHIFAQKSLSHSHSLSLSLFLTLTLFQSLIQSLSTCWTSFVFISMLKSRCCRRKLQWSFFDIVVITTLSCDVWVHRAGSQLKNSEISRIHFPPKMLCKSYGYLWFPVVK